MNNSEHQRTSMGSQTFVDGKFFAKRICVAPPSARKVKLFATLARIVYNLMKRTKISLVVCLGLVGSQWAVAASPKLEPAPEAKKQPVKDSYYGITISDDYRWFEDLKSPEVQVWAQKQTQRAEKFLGALPGRAAIAHEVRKLISAQP